MRQYWVSESIRELAGFSAPARRRIWAEAYRRTRWGWWRITSAALGAAVVVSLLCIWEWWAYDGGGADRGFRGLAQMLVVVMAGQVVSRQIGIRAAMPYVRRAARERCERCGGMRDASGACGECAVVVEAGCGSGTAGAIEYQDAEARREEERARGEGAQERAYLLVLLAVVVAVGLTATLVIRYAVRWRAASPPPAAVWGAPVVVPTTQQISGGGRDNVAGPGE
jgi:hypothetical protein